MDLTSFPPFVRIYHYEYQTVRCLRCRLSDRSQSKPKVGQRTKFGTDTSATRLVFAVGLQSGRCSVGWLFTQFVKSERFVYCNDIKVRVLCIAVFVKEARILIPADAVPKNVTVKCLKCLFFGALCAYPSYALIVQLIIQEGQSVRGLWQKSVPSS